MRSKSIRQKQSTVSMPRGSLQSSGLAHILSSQQNLLTPRRRSGRECHTKLKRTSCEAHSQPLESLPTAGITAKNWPDAVITAENNPLPLGPREVRIVAGTIAEKNLLPRDSSFTPAKFTCRGSSQKKKKKIVVRITHGRGPAYYRGNHHSY